MKKIHRTIIVTVAGKATRFNADLKEPTLKCLYHEGDVKKCSLYKLLEKCKEYDEIILVGGYLFDKLKETIENDFDEFKDRIKLVYNSYYDSFSSGYSLVSGILQVNNSTDETVFVEGDLMFDENSFIEITKCKNNVISYNNDPITAAKSVIFYINDLGAIKYKYDDNHKSLKINEPITAIYNSAQVWKFIDIQKLKQTVNEMLPMSLQNGNGLDLITQYLNKCATNDISIILISNWHNCNTIKDYSHAIKMLLK
jgi:choline kinase